MSRTIVFVGGIHGVGKSRLIKEVCNQLNYEYLSASELIKWSLIQTDPKNKKVTDINTTQKLLLEVLASRSYSKICLLDGHFCLLDKNEIVSPIPEMFFRQIDPKILVIIEDDCYNIQDRLFKRDGNLYSLDLLSELQRNEIKHAKHLSFKLNKDLLVVNTTGKDQLIKEINTLIN